ncbi:VPS10 domain-containing receptor SorCS1 precursor, partial [Pterulicium gracile]
LVLSTALLSLLLLVGTTHATEPSHSVSYFKYLPLRFSFFEDTPVAIYHDGGYGNVYISQNEGKSWVRRSDIPEGEAKSFVKHPFDNNYAFVLSKGKKHWRTADRVKTWHSFKMPLAPAITATPLSFHSDK